MYDFDFKAEKEKRRLNFINEHQQEWIQEGRRFCEIRDKLGITRREICDMMGISKHTIEKFETGKPIERRQFVVNSYTMALKSFVNQMEADIRSIKFGWLYYGERPLSRGYII